MIQIGARLEQKLRSLDNEASTSEPVADAACPQPILGKRGCDIQCKAVRSRLTSEVNGAEKQSWLWESTLDACYKHYQCKVIKVKARPLTEIKEILDSIASHKVYYMGVLLSRGTKISVCLPLRYSNTRIT